MWALCIAILAFLPICVYGDPTVVTGVEKYFGLAKFASYVVKLNDGVSRSDFLASLEQHLGDGDAITYDDWDTGFLNAFTARLSQPALYALRTSGDIEYITEDGVMTTMDVDTPPVLRPADNDTITETDAPWNLQTISQTTNLSVSDPTALTYTYRYNAAAGSGVDIYVVDTGVYTNHSDFGGRATWGVTFGGYADEDGNGHGTQVTGTAAGTQFGVAKESKVIVVKVLDDTGSGYVSDILAGLNWIMANQKTTGRPSVVTLSLGGAASTSMTNAVTALTAAGIHVAVAAGNSVADAIGTSPANAPTANTAGASTAAGVLAPFSNYGALVDIVAPGADVPTTSIGGSTATTSVSGTSVAAAHVAGMIAYFISVYGNMPPAAMTALLQSYATNNTLSGIPAGTVNYLLRNDIA